MSHSQFRRVKTYTETCMDESLRQAYDYWQDQPGSIRRRPLPKKQRQLVIEMISIKVNYCLLSLTVAKIQLRISDDSLKIHANCLHLGNQLALLSLPNSWLRLNFNPNATVRVSHTPSVRAHDSTKLWQDGILPASQHIIFIEALIGPAAIRATDYQTHYFKTKPI